MSWKTGYISDPVGRCHKIEDLSEREVGRLISIIYGKLRTHKVSLNALHDRLWHLRKKGGSNKERTNTNSKILKELKLKPEEPSRMQSIVLLALKHLEAGGELSIIKAILEQASDLDD